jgi:putative PEP-CTERM system TPR-repeat lipoprotein
MKLRLLPVLLALLVQPAMVLADPAAAYYEKARQYSQQQQWREAELELRNSLQQNPAYLPARLMLGQVLLKAGNWSSAEKELQLALDGGAAAEPLIYDLMRSLLAQQKTDMTLYLLEKYPQYQQSADWLLMKANVLKAQQKFDEAEQFYQKSLQLNPTPLLDEIHLNQAELKLKQHQFTEASTILTQIPKHSPLYRKSRYLQAQLFQLQQQPEQALAIWQAVLKDEPADPVALLGQAQIWQSMGKLSEALQSIIDFREKYPFNPYGQLIHASLIGAQGDAREQSRMFRQLQMQLNNLPEDSKEQEDVLLLSATLEFNQERYDAAIVKLKRAAQLYPNNVQINQLLANALVRQQDYKSAQLVINSALAISDQQYELYLLGAFVAQQLRDPSTEQALITKALKLFPQQQEVRKAYLQLLLRQNKSNEARTLLSAQPEHQLSDLLLLGYLQLEQGLLKDAAATAQKLLTLDNSKVEIYLLAGDVAAKSGDAELGEKFYREVLKLDAKYKPALLSLASQSLQKNDWDSAIGFYQQILQQTPDDELVLQLMADASLRLGKTAEAIELLAKLPASGQSSAPARIALLELYLQSNMLEQATVLLKELQEQTDINPEVYFAKLRLALQQNDLTEFNRVADILLGLWYDVPTRLLSLAELQLQAGSNTEVLKTMQRLESLQANELELAYLQARLALQQNRLAQGRQILQRLQQQSGSSDRVIELQAHFYLAEQQYDQARPLIEKLYSKSGHRQHMLLLFKCLYKDQAAQQQLIRQWLSNQPNDTGATLALAELLQNAKDSAGLIELYRQSPLLETHPVIQNNLANLLMSTAPAEALQYASKAYRLLPEQPDILDTYGYALMHTGQVEQGLGILRQAEIRQPKSALIQLHIAEALLQLKRADEAKQVLNTLQNKQLTAEEQHLFDKLKLQ